MRAPRAGSDIATRARVGRVTLYAHFADRADLVRELFAREVDAADESLQDVDLEGEPVSALERLVRSSWRVVHDAGSLLAAAEQELPAQTIRRYHDGPLLRVRRLIERGQAEGAFRTDLTPAWLTAMFFASIHGAAAEIRAGRLDEATAPDVVVATLTSLFVGPR